jgi:hypothetical protein
MVIHGALLVAVHEQAIDPPTITDPLDPLAGTVTDSGEREIAQPCPAWVTVACCPPMVRVALRSWFVLFAAMLRKTEPLLVPLKPDVTVIHDAVLVVVHWQPGPAVTVIPLNWAAGLSARLVGESDTLQPGAAWVTENWRPPIVSAADREAVVVFAVIE